MKLEAIKPKIILFQPDIAQNVGSIIRTSVCFGLEVHLIEPMGFPWHEGKLKRAGMDYLARANVQRHKSWAAFLQVKAEIGLQNRLVALTTKGSTELQNFTFERGDFLLFGQESAGLPEHVHTQAHARVKIPMVAGERSINLAQSCAIVSFEALRQQGF